MHHMSEKRLHYIAEKMQQIHVIVGKQDKLVDASCSKQLCDAMPGSKLWVLEEGGHGTQYDGFQLVSKILVEFAETTSTFSRAA